MKAFVLTLSDKGSRGEREDTAGPAAAELLSKAGFEVIAIEILPDDIDTIKQKLTELSSVVNLIITAGGTGLAPRDVAPEATRAVIDREVPGIAETIRQEGLKKTPRAILTRGIAGLRGSTLIINLPGSEKAVREGIEAIAEVLPHAVEKAMGSDSDCAR